MVYVVLGGAHADILTDGVQGFIMVAVAVGVGLLFVTGYGLEGGFSGMLAIHPAQVATINDAFLPSEAEVERAERIVALFAANPDAGALGLDGEMIDRPHLVQARRLLQTKGK